MKKRTHTIHPVYFGLLAVCTAGSSFSAETLFSSAGATVLGAASASCYYDGLGHHPGRIALLGALGIGLLLYKSQSHSNAYTSNSYTLTQSTGDGGTISSTVSSGGVTNRATNVRGSVTQSTTSVTQSITFWPFGSWVSSTQSITQATGGSVQYIRTTHRSDRSLQDRLWKVGLKAGCFGIGWALNRFLRT